MEPTLPQIHAVRSGTTLLLIIGSDQIAKTGTEDEIRTLYNAVTRYNQNQTEANYDAVVDIISPTRRALKEGVLEIDQLGRVFLAGTTVPIPSDLSDMLFRYIEAGLPIDPLVNFWRLSLLNPNTEARDAFFRYVKSFNITITPSGEVLLYKAVTHKEDPPDFDTDVQAFVARAMTAVQRHGGSLDGLFLNRNTNGTFIAPTGSLIEEGQLFLDNGQNDYDDTVETLGSLASLAEKVRSLPTRALYTDKHSRTMDIRIGEPAWKERSQCDPNMSIDCSHGLHVGAYQYVKSFGSNPNDTILACLVNPMNVVAVPDYDHSKMRVCEYFPYSIMERGQDGAWQEIDSPYFEAAYAPYLTGSILDRLEDFDKFDGGQEMDEKALVMQEQLRSVARQMIVEIGVPEASAIRRRSEDAQAPPDADGFSGQDRDSYSDIQDRSSYEPTDEKGFDTAADVGIDEDEGSWLPATRPQFNADLDAEIEYARFNLQASDSRLRQLYGSLSTEYKLLSKRDFSNEVFHIEGGISEPAVDQDAEPLLTLSVSGQLVQVPFSLLQVFVPEDEEDEEDWEDDIDEDDDDFDDDDGSW